MANLPSVTDIVKLVKAGATIEWQEKVMELRQAAVDQEAVIVDLRKRILELEAAIGNATTGDRCPKCRTGTFALVSSSPDPVFGDLGMLLRVYECEQCKFQESHQFNPAK